MPRSAVKVVVPAWQGKWDQGHNQTFEAPAEDNQSIQVNRTYKDIGLALYATGAAPATSVTDGVGREIHTTESAAQGTKD